MSAVSDAIVDEILRRARELLVREGTGSPACAPRSAAEADRMDLALCVGMHAALEVLREQGARIP